MKTFILRPTSKYTSSYSGAVHYQQVLILEKDDDGEEFIHAVFHIDTFYEKDDKVIYDRLDAGEEIAVQIVEVLE